MSVSGRLSSCSVIQEENLARRMHKTPRTPIKIGYDVTPRKSESKRSLFQSDSPTNSDDLGLMSPLSSSSCSSSNSLDSPQFSPNGKFSTPPRTPRRDGLPVRSSPRIASKKIEVKSSLFPDLKVHTPKTRRTPKTPRTILSKLLTPQSSLSSFDEVEEGIRSLSTPPTPRSSGRRQIFGEENVVAESDSSPCSSQEESSRNKSHDEPTKLGIKPLSCESFYGPVPQPPKAKTKLFIDSLEPRSRGRELVRSLSRDSLSSNKSFVSGGTRKRTQSNTSQRSQRPKSSDRRRAPHVGVWHNIKRPRQIKKIKKPEKPAISPQARIAQMIKTLPSSEIKVKSKRLFQENPRKRVANLKKRRRADSGDDGIIDSFPDHLIKRKKLPTSRVSVHPAIVKSPENSTPDPNKKFVKYGQTRKATFTLNDNVKLQISDGIMKLQTPKKRRKLYSGKKDVIEDFNDFDDGDNDIEQNIQGILNRLQNDKEAGLQQKGNVEAEKVSGAKPFNGLEIRTKATPTKTGSKSQRSPLKTVSNMPMMILNDFDSDDNDENCPLPTDPSTYEKKSNEVTLAKTGNMVSYLTNILVNEDQEVETNLFQTEDEIENSPPNQKNYFSLFYKQNWNKTSTAINDVTNIRNQSAKKKVLVPDDQYLLDAGQKSIGIVTCKKCGVMYQSGDFADEATHYSFHNHLPELRFMGWNNERVVGKFPDGRVIMILNADPKIWWQKVSKIVEIVDQELGFPEASVQSLFYKTVYLYINEKSKQIAGCLIAENCKVAYKMFPPLEGVEIDSCSKDPSPCKIGISRIWTALSHRRKGVASRMVECLQKTFFFGEIVSLDQIAFSVPTPAGKLLAQKVTGRMDFLVYGFP